MATSRKVIRTRTRSFKVGDRVRFRFGMSRATGVIIEDRGCLGVGGRRLYAVRARIDPYNDTVLELRADEIQAA